ncbi:MAG: hypothetical protein R3362_05415 [Rhodothermales bacterium]|nr:hypothetical protein [Rhodothermales bacterium]
MRLLVCSLAASLLLLAAPLAVAQSTPEWATPGTPSGPPPPPPAELLPGGDSPPDFPVPIDPLGLGLLGAAGALYAVRRLRGAGA